MPGVVHEHVDAAELVGRPLRRTRRAPSRSARSTVHARESGACSRQRSSTSSSLSARRAQMPTVAPRCAKPSASAAPIPADAPVTKHVLAVQVVGHGADASLRARCRSRPTPCCSPVAAPSSPARRRASARRSRPRSPASVPTSRSATATPTAWRAPRPRSRPTGRHAHAELLDVRDGDAVRAWIAPLDRRRRARQQRGRRLPRRVPRRERQGPGRARPRELHERHALHPRRACRRCPTTGGSIVNITSIEAHRAAPGYAVYSAMKAALVNLTQVARARARRPPHPRQLHRARRDPDAGHRRRPAGEDAAAVRGPRRRRRGRGRSTSRPTGRASSPARRSTSTAATSRRAVGDARPDGSWVTAGEPVA